MSKTNYPGIDYAAGQTVNRNPETGFRYGVINTNALGEFAWDEITNHGVDQDWADYCDEIKAGIRSALSDAIRGDRLTQSVSDANPLWRIQLKRIVAIAWARTGLILSLPVPTRFTQSQPGNKFNLPPQGYP